MNLWIRWSLRAVGVSDDHAAIMAESLVQTSLWGIDSHGIARLPHYLDRITHGSVNPCPNIRFNRTGAATAQVDAGNALGIVASHFAMDRAIELAREAGAGIVGVGNSSHCGAIGLYTRQACKADMVGIAFTHSDSLVVPHLGRKAFQGTNPISIAFPSRDRGRPLCVDTATSVVSWNRIMNARRDGQLLPLGWGVDANGDDCTDPHQVVAVKPMAEHKGYALAFLIDMLCGPLNGMPFGPHIPIMYGDIAARRRIGALLIALDYHRFGGEHLPEVVSTAVAEAKALGREILFPGEPEYRTEAIRRESGIPIEPAQARQIESWSRRLSVALPEYSIAGEHGASDRRRKGNQP
jgi:ureidoglycolate dehydrogenase (NAD+)